ncbi:M23 family metallopeptidase [Alkalicaulis satelles]|uniref:M23 family metallopeptidase n=1 Tax=Alkalicaulis satelles TaxID=2609175 RepID=A0A5M6ZF58_9PROT|nr:peptidoglycan DD-metalloendopeptidase family protein [Alkalicaulis satelles]KAA5803376.1 M23 family metallopeptidase [Alkalicaulis satelles]
MSGFDVRLADARRSRTLVFFATLGLGLLIVVGALLMRFSGPGEPSVPAEPVPASPQAVQALSETARSGAPEAAPAAVALNNSRDVIEAEHALFTSAPFRSQVESLDITVRSGQTMASVLAGAGADRVEAARAIAALDPVFPVRRLRAGQDLTLFFETVADEEEGEARRLAGLSFRPDIERTLTVARSGDRFRAREATATLDREFVRVRGEVSSSLYMSAIQQGATDRIVVELANILGYAVDFRTIQPGDDFDFVFERHVNRRGETVRTGDIVYVRFAGRGSPLEYFRYTAPDGEVGYYTGEGEAAQRLLMRMPVNGARISSSFGMRFHPIHQVNRPHNGTDFAAPRGTPIMAAGNGVVERADWFGGFGNYVRIRHANGYQTVYAHLQGFARGVRAGTRVSQGQVIGYVGCTGSCTGPHLHYEVHQNGRPLNPMRLDLPTGRRLTRDELPSFTTERDRLIAKRDSVMFANGQPPAIQAEDAVLLAARESGRSQSASR